MGVPMNGEESKHQIKLNMNENCISDNHVPVVVTGCRVKPAAPVHQMFPVETSKLETGDQEMTRTFTVFGRRKIFLWW